jgi:predicted ATPase/DNA-binding SARP family transcriptional activator
MPGIGLEFCLVISFPMHGVGMKFGILGPIEAWAGGEPLPLGGSRQLAVYSFLLLHANRMVTSDALIDKVWGGDRAGGTKRLSVAVARLRRALVPLGQDGASVLRTVGGGYMMAVGPSDLDASCFEDLVRDGLEYLGAGRAAQARDRLRAALDLWRGPALAEMRFEEFAQGEISRLEEMRLVAIEARIDADLQVGPGGDLIGELAALLVQHPARERTAGQLMLALYRSGRQAEALDVYQRTRIYLREELGLDPGHALRALEAQILEQAPALSEPASAGDGTPPKRAAVGAAVPMVVAPIDEPARENGEGEYACGDLRPQVWELLGRLWAPIDGAWIAEWGNGLLGLFPSAGAGVASALAAARLPGTADWPHASEVSLRLGVHTGQLRISGGVYWGEDVQYATRVAGAAHGGQVLVSGVTAGLVTGSPLVDLGEHRLSDFPVPRRLFAVGEGPHRPPRTSDPLRSNLPSVHGPLIGRDAELAELVATLRTGRHRLLTITGPGGSGKTSLALAVADAMVDDLADGAFLVELAQVNSPGAVASAIAAALGIPLQGRSDPGLVIANAVSDRKVLLVLDNFEHLLGAAPLIAGLVVRARQLRVMVTSQAPMRVRGEKVLALRPLDVPDRDDEESVAATSAGRLLIERAREADPAFAMTPGNASSVARLCRALGGLPLAIELAAARLTLLSPLELLGRMQDGIEALGRGSRDLPERQRGLRAALNWTHRLLTDDEVRLLRGLGVFTGPVSLERIERVCGGDLDLLEALARLVDLSFVVRAGDGRFLLHAGVRDYAREKLAAAVEGAELARRHGLAFAEAAEKWGNRLLFNAGEVQAAVFREEADVGAALTWAAETDPQSFALLAGGVSMSMLFVARLPPWADAIEQALAGPDIPPGPKAWLLLAASLIAFQRQDMHLARTRLASTVATAAETADERLICLMRACSILFLVLSGAYDGVRDQHSLLSERVAKLGHRDLLLLVAGLEPYVLAYCEGRYAEAGALWAGLIADPTRTDFAAWTAPFCWPDCTLLTGAYRTALDGYRAGLRSARERGQSPTMAYQLEGISMSLSGLGRHDEAMEAAGWAASVRQSAGPALNSWYRDKFADSVRRSRDVLGTHLAGAAYARGRALTLDGAVTAALGATAAATPEPAEASAVRPASADVQL